MMLRKRTLAGQSCFAWSLLRKRLLICSLFSLNAYIYIYMCVCRKKKKKKRKWLVVLDARRSWWPSKSNFYSSTSISPPERCLKWPFSESFQALAILIAWHLWYLFRNKPLSFSKRNLYSYRGASKLVNSPSAASSSLLF